MRGRITKTCKVSISISIYESSSHSPQEPFACIKPPSKQNVAQTPLVGGFRCISSMKLPEQWVEDAKREVIASQQFVHAPSALGMDRSDK